MAARLITLTFDDPSSDVARSFSRHLQDLLNLSEDDIDKCLEAMPAIRLTRTKTQQHNAIDLLANKCAAETHSVLHAISVINFFVDGLLSDQLPEKDHETWADDLIEKKLLEPEQAGKFRSIIDILVQNRSNMQRQADEQRSSAGVLPSFKTFGYTVEVRPVRKEVYHWGTELANYHPEILGTVQVASIHIGVDEGVVKDIYFQVDEAAVDEIISSLQAAKKDFEAFREYLNQPKFTGGDEYERHI